MKKVLLFYSTQEDGLFGGTTTKFRLNIVLGCLFLFQPKTFRQWHKPLKVSVSRPRDTGGPKGARICSMRSQGTRRQHQEA